MRASGQLSHRKDPWGNPSFHCHREELQRCPFPSTPPPPEAFHSSGRSYALCLGPPSPAGTRRASDIGAGRNEPASFRLFPVPLCSLFVLCSATLSVLYSHSPAASSLLYSCVTVQVFLGLVFCCCVPSLADPSYICGWHHPHAPLPLWSGARWAGGRGLESWPLDGPVPPMLA